MKIPLPRALKAVALVGILALAPVQAPLGAGAAVEIRRIYWGAYASGVQYGWHDAPWDMRSATRFESTVGKGMSLLQWGLAWYDTNSSSPGFQRFPTELMDLVRSRGSIPVLNWGSYEAPGTVDQPRFSLASILAGNYDWFIEDWAAAAAAWGHPFFLRFDWEMNTNSRPYSEAANGNSPGEFAAMWRHVHDIFEAAGADNVTWLWCPNVDYPGSLPIAGLYPGHDYVDWVGLDGYNWGTNPARPGSKWQTPSEVFRASYEQLVRLAPGKPVMIGETASTEYGGSKAAWIARLLSELAAGLYPQVRGVVWFNKNADGMDWIIETSEQAKAAFRWTIASPVFAPNEFRGLADTPIGPPCYGCGLTR